MTFFIVMLFNCFNLIQTTDDVQGHSSVRIALGKSTATPLGLPVTTYFATIAVGTPPKAYKFLIDTDARETWLPQYSTEGNNQLHYNTGYSKNTSSSSVELNQTTTFKYQGSELVGKVYDDTLRFTNLANTSVVIRQRFLSILSVSNGKFADLQVDGVLNLNPSLTTDSGLYTISINLNLTNYIDANKFFVWFDTSINSEQGGELTFGNDINPTRYNGVYRYHSIVKPHYRWELNLYRVALGSDYVSCESQISCTAILSTGVNDFYAPREDVYKIAAILGLNKTNNETTEDMTKLYELECSRVSGGLPRLYLSIDNTPYVVSPRSYIKQKIGAKLSGPDSNSTTCYLSILPNDSPNQWILGTNFLENYYAAFDVDKRRVGLIVKGQHRLDQASS